MTVYFLMTDNSTKSWCI